MNQKINLFLCKSYYLYNIKKKKKLTISEDINAGIVLNLLALCYSYLITNGDGFKKILNPVLSEFKNKILFNYNSNR